jgi:eukaryotic-like serine/threonine-protein kinase
MGDQDTTSPGNADRGNEAAVTVSTSLPDRLGRSDAVTIAHALAPEKDDAGGRKVDQPTGSPARYLILAEVGQGGMALVHAARDTELLRKVAIKSMGSGVGRDAGMRARFLREAQITAQLEHPHVVPVYSLEAVEQGLPAYTMKLVQGRTFEQYLDETATSYRQGRQPDESHSLPARLEHFLKVCDAIAYAHDKGVVHRDLKPANVMIGRHNEVYVMDWGICRLQGESGGETLAGASAAVDADAARTQDGLVVGTPRYMAPEQAEGRNEDVGPHTDQCALGLMLHELVTLQAPYAGVGAVEILINAARGRVQPMSPAFAGMPVPRELRAIVARATAMDPARRYSSVHELAADIRRFMRGEAVMARPDNPWQRAARALARHRQATLVALFGLVALVASSISLLLWQQERALQATYAREQREATLLSAVTRQGDRLQTRLLLLQGEVDALAAMAAQLLQHGRESDHTAYWLSDFQQQGSAPADFGRHPGYQDPVSLAHGVWFTAPELSPAGLQADTRRLMSLRGYAADLFDQMRITMGTVSTGAGPAQHSGVAEFLLALETGLAYRYPGSALPRGQFDARQRPWYRLAMENPRAAWGRPFISAVNGKVKLPVAHPIREPGGPLLGAVAITLRMDDVLRNLQSDLALPGLRQTMLLDAQGEILAAMPPRQHETDDAGEIKPERFPDAALFRALEQRDLGLIETRAFGKPELIVFDRVDPLGWVVLALVDEAAVGAASE